MEEVLTWLNANSGAVSAVATVAAALIAAGALVSAARDSRSRSRPMVSAEFRPAPNSDSAIQVLLKNYGPSAAEKVEVTFSPELPEDDDTAPVRLRYQNGVSVLNPGQELVNTWFIPKFGVGNKFEGNVYTYPDVVTLSIRYRSGWHKYLTTVNLDINVMLHHSSVVSSTSLLGSVQSMTKSLGEIAKSTNAIANNMQQE